MSLSTVYDWLVDGLREAGSEEAAVEAQMLLEAATGWGRLMRVTDPDRPVPQSALRLLEEWVGARIRRVPLQHLVGHAHFWGHKLRVTPEVLIPRADTEILVEEALGVLQQAPELDQVVDLGTGSGAIALAIKHARPHLRVWAIDKSEAALAVAKSNGEDLRVDVAWVLGDGWEAVDKAVNWSTCLLLSNPPYIPTQELASLQPEVRYDPALALDGGEDGLDFYRRLRRAPAAWLAAEVGAGQAPIVSKMWQDDGWRIERIGMDLGGVARVVVAKR